MRLARTCFASALCLAILASIGFAQPPARGGDGSQPQRPPLRTGNGSMGIAFQEMQEGRQALAAKKFDEAIQHFDKVLEASPTNVNAHVYLGSAYAQKYVPGDPSADNISLAKMAIINYQKVFDDDQFNTFSLVAAKGIALLDAQMGNFDEAKFYYEKAKGLAPKDPEPYYLTALVDWTQASQLRAQQRTRLNLKPEDSLPAKDPKVCLTVKEKNWSRLEDGISNLKKALELRPDYQEAMSYMHLIYLERADIECTSPEGRKADLQAASDWTQKLATAKKLQAAHPQTKQDDDDD